MLGLIIKHARDVKWLCWKFEQENEIKSAKIDELQQ